LRSGVPIVKAQRILGHSDPRLTAAAYVAFDVEDLRDAVEGMPVIGEGAQPWTLMSWIFPSDSQDREKQ
jgi:hypothetical protein